jgi:hypothetical protein
MPLDVVVLPMGWVLDLGTRPAAWGVTYPRSIKRPMGAHRPATTYDRRQDFLANDKVVKSLEEGRVVKKKDCLHGLRSGSWIRKSYGEVLHR